MKCYKLVFDGKYFKKNAGSIILLIFIFFYLIFLICYIMKGITPLELETSHFIFEENENESNINKDDIEIANPSLTLKEKNQGNINKIKGKRGIKNTKNNDKNNPPRKIKGKGIRLTSAERKRREENLKLVDIIAKNRRKSTLKSLNQIKKIKKLKLMLKVLNQIKLLKEKL